MAGIYEIPRSMHHSWGSLREAMLQNLETHMETGTGVVNVSHCPDVPVGDLGVLTFGLGAYRFMYL